MLVDSRISLRSCTLLFAVALAHGCNGGQAEPTAAEEAARDKQHRAEELKQFGTQVANDQVSFDLIRTSADDEWMALLEGKPIVSLRINNRPITDKGLAHLAGNTALKELLMEGSQISDGGMKELRSMTSLENVSLSPGITDQGLAPLAELKNLKVLNLSDHITDAGVPYLVRIESLESVGPLTGVTGQGLEQLTKLKNLSGLSLFNAPITDADLDHLKQFAKLTHLTLSGTKITDAGLLKLAELPKLEVLFVTNVAGITDKGVQKLIEVKPALRDGIVR